MAGRRTRAGFTMIEFLIAMGLMVVVLTKVSLVMSASSSDFRQRSEVATLEDRARRAVDRIGYAIMGSSRDSLFPEQESPIFSEELAYELHMGVQDGEIVWSDPEWIGLSEDQTSIVWSQNPGGSQEKRVVWCNLVRPFLNGEILNGMDDNENELADEKGLSFEINGNKVTVRLCLEGAPADGQPAVVSVEPPVTCRN